MKPNKTFLVLTSASFLIILLFLSGCGGECGPGTILQDGECVLATGTNESGNSDKNDHDPSAGCIDENSCADVAQSLGTILQDIREEVGNCDQESPIWDARLAKVAFDCATDMKESQNEQYCKDYHHEYIKNNNISKIDPMFWGATKTLDLQVTIDQTTGSRSIRYYMTDCNLTHMGIGIVPDMNNGEYWLCIISGGL